MYINLRCYISAGGYCPPKPTTTTALKKDPFGGLCHPKSFVFDIYVLGHPDKKYIAVFVEVRHWFS